MQDRDIVNDLLGGTKASINCYTTGIVECSNQQLRNTFKTLRDEAEQMQYQLYQMAEQKGYYMPAPPAAPNDIQKIKSSFSAAMTNTNTNANSTNTNIYSGAGVSNSSLNQQQPSMVSSNNQKMTNTVNHNMTNSTNQSMTNSINKKNTTSRH